MEHNNQTYDFYDKEINNKFYAYCKKHQKKKKSKIITSKGYKRLEKQEEALSTLKSEEGRYYNKVNGVMDNIPKYLSIIMATVGNWENQPKKQTQTANERKDERRRQRSQFTSNMRNTHERLEVSIKECNQDQSHLLKTRNQQLRDF